MMRELIKSNFKKLNVDIEEEDLYFIGPWNGYANAEELFKLNEYFEKALDNNEKLKIYNQRSLKRVFDIRLSEATTGRLSYLIIGNAKEYKGFKHNVKKIFYPLYKPFKNQMTKINKESNIELLNRIEILEEELDELKSLINKGK
jgi:hypothetical protein